MLALPLAERFPDAPPASGNASIDLLQTVEDRPGHDRRYAIDSTRIKTELAFDSAIIFKIGLTTTVDWYLNNEPWWKKGD